MPRLAFGVSLLHHIVWDSLSAGVHHSQQTSYCTRCGDVLSLTLPSTLLGSGYMPSLEKTNPQYSTLVFRHFLTVVAWLSHVFWPTERGGPSWRPQPCSEFLSLFSLCCLRLTPFEDILWTDCLDSILAARVFQSSIAFLASKNCGSVNWGFHWQFLSTAAQPDLGYFTVNVKGHRWVITD